jgi:hypothetical protein
MVMAEAAGGDLLALVATGAALVGTVLVVLLTTRLKLGAMELSFETDLDDRETEQTAMP